MKLFLAIVFIQIGVVSSAQETKITNIQKVNTMNANGPIRYIRKVENLYILDKPETPSKENYTLEYDKAKSLLIAKPKEGIWGRPFFAYPENDTAVEGRICGSSGLLSVGYYSFTINFFKEQESNRFKAMATSSEGPATFSHGYSFQFKIFPPLLIFGDYNDTTKWYYLELR